MFWSVATAERWGRSLGGPPSRTRVNENRDDPIPRGDRTTMTRVVRGTSGVNCSCPTVTFDKMADFYRAHKRVGNSTGRQIYYVFWTVLNWSRHRHLFTSKHMDNIHGRFRIQWSNNVNSNIFFCVHFRQNNEHIQRTIVKTIKLLQFDLTEVKSL